MFSLITSLLGCSEYSLNLTKEDTAVPEAAPPIPVEIPYSFSEMVAPCRVDNSLCWFDTSTGSYSTDCTDVIDTYDQNALHLSEVEGEHTVLVAYGGGDVRPDESTGSTFDLVLGGSYIIYTSGDHKEQFFDYLKDSYFPWWDVLGQGFFDMEDLSDLQIDACGVEESGIAPILYNTERDYPSLRFSSGQGLAEGSSYPPQLYHSCYTYASAEYNQATIAYYTDFDDLSESNCLYFESGEECILTTACAAYEEHFDAIEQMTRSLAYIPVAGVDNSDPYTDLIYYAAVYFCNESGECSNYYPE